MGVVTTLEPLHLGASYTIGSHILPGKPIVAISEIVKKKIKLDIGTCDEIIDGVKAERYDYGLIETPLFDDTLIYNEWMEDELVICSKMPLPESSNENDIHNYRLICRKEGSLTRMVISKFFSQWDLSYQSFWSLSEIDNATAAIQSVKWAKPNPEHPTVAIVSQLSIEHELQQKELYTSRIHNQPLVRKFYLIYKQENTQQQNVETIIRALKNWR